MRGCAASATSSRARRERLEYARARSCLRPTWTSSEASRTRCPSGQVYLRRTVGLLCALAAACDPAPEADAGAPDASALDAGHTPTDVCADDGGLLLGGDCMRAAVRLRPLARIGGAWVGRDATCAPEGAGVACPVGIGVLRLEVAGDLITVALEASEDVVVEGLVAEGPLALDGAATWISNGFHSRSQSGALAIGALATDDALFAALAERGDTEVLRDGTALSWELTVVGGGETALLAGAIAAARFRPWTQVGTGEGGTTLRLGSGGIERVAVPSGDTLRGEPFRVAFGAVEPLLRAHAAALPARASAAHAEAGWNSWYELWDGVDEAAVRANAARALEVIGPRAGAAPLRVVVDDGWQRAWGDWLPNERFPSGLDGLATDLRADGVVMGVWLAPLLVAEGSETAALHPEWLVGGATYEHAKHGTMRILDVTHPDAAAHLAATIARIVGWGYSLLKIDLLFAGTFEGERNADVTGMEAYHRALAIVREAAGEDTLLLTVGAPGLASLPYSDSWRVGGDIALEPFGAGWAWIPNQARALAVRFPYCLRVLCDADPPILRAPLTREEVETGAWVVAFSGGALFVSDDLRTLPDERVEWGLAPEVVALALGGAPALPEDYLPAGAPRRLAHAIGDHVSRDGASTHVVPSIWRAPDGRRRALNATEAPRVIEGVEIPPRAVRVLP